MRFGIIGAGPIASGIAEKMIENGHDVKIADARGMERLEGKKLAGTPVPVQEVVANIDVLIVSIPFHALPSLRGIIDQVEEHVVVVDTSNYYPQMGGRIEEVENGMIESVWVSEQLGRPIIKAFNNLLAYTLQRKGTAEGVDGRIAAAVAGDNRRHKETAMNIVNEAGFDPVDGGSLSDSWRQQPGTPAYCTELAEKELIEALQQADKEKASIRRDQAMEKLSTAAETYSHEDIVRLNRELYNAGS